jgi:hypothetical protein
MMMMSFKRSAIYNETTHTWRLWTRSDCINALKLAFEDEVMTIKEYETFRLQDPGVFPSTATVSQKCGGWKKAVADAGYKPRGRGKRYQRDYVWDQSDASSEYLVYDGE